MSLCETEDVYRIAGITSDVVSEADVASFILGAEEKIIKYTGRNFQADNDGEDWIDIEDLDQDDEINTIFLDNVPVTSITSIESYNLNGDVEKTWSTSEYWADLKIGRIRLRSDYFEHQNRRVKVVYTYGYSSVPAIISETVAIMAAMACLIKQIGGTYDDVTSYSLPSGVSIGVGEPYTNMREAITRLEKERDLLFKTIGNLRNNIAVI
jgi:hypothetical protein